MNNNILIEALKTLKLATDRGIQKGIFQNVEEVLAIANAIKVLDNDISNRTTDKNSSDSVNHGNS